MQAEEARATAGFEVVIAARTVVRVPNDFDEVALIRLVRAWRLLMLPTQTRIFVYAQPAGMRRSFDALGECVREALKPGPQSGALFLLAGKSGSSLRILWWDSASY